MKITSQALLRVVNDKRFQNLSQQFHALIKCLEEPDIPVRIVAVDALATLVEKQPSGIYSLPLVSTLSHAFFVLVEAALKPMVGKIVQGTGFVIVGVPG